MIKIDYLFGSKLENISIIDQYLSGDNFYTNILFLINLAISLSYSRWCNFFISLKSGPLNEILNYFMWNMIWVGSY